MSTKLGTSGLQAGEHVRQESKTAQIMRLRAQGLTSREIAADIGSHRDSVRTLIWRALNPEKANRRQREAARRYRARMTPEQKANRYYRQKCREAGVDPAAGRC